jgi:diguanylate cyclase (GGDEF)-like protein/PAS domain S-box-containing protein
LNAVADFPGRALEAARIGGWEYDIATGRLWLTPRTYSIIEIPPEALPLPTDALKFFTANNERGIRRAAARAIKDGTGWDLELPVTTAKGRHLWVRTCGQAVNESGQPVRLAGAIEDITTRRALAQLTERLSLVCRQTTNSVIITDTAGRIEWVNEAFVRLSGHAMHEIYGRVTADVLHGAATDPVTARHEADCIARGEGYDIEILKYTRQGETFWVSLAGAPMRDESGAVTGYISVCADITARRGAEAAARQEMAERQKTEALLRDVLEALPSAVTVYDANDRFVMYNAAYADMFPIAARLAEVGRPFEEVLRLAAAAGQFPDAGTTPEERSAWAEACIAEHRKPTRDGCIVQLPDGRSVQARQRRSDSGNVVCVRSDTTALVRAQAELRLQAEHDPLTAIGNRAALMRALAQSLRGNRDGVDGTGALLLFDLDDFKQVNDRFGHDVGDAMLITVAERMRAYTRSGDVAARLGGDEFALLMPGLEETDLRARMDALQAALSAPVDVGQRRLHISISAGAALFPRDGQDCESLLKNADLALYDAKRAGHGHWCPFHPEQAAAHARYGRLATSLRQAITDRAIQIALQPARSLRGGHAGFEALARWHDTGRWVAPEEFIVVADEIGLSSALGGLIIEAALSRVAALRGLGFATGRVAINVAASQLLDDNFIDGTLVRLQRHGMTPQDLELEVTETVLLGRHADRVARALRELKRRGITLTLDDFGTGLASLRELSALPIDRLKIDRSFVSGIGAPGAGGKIARTVIGMARGLEMRSVAEGVETAAQVAFLRAEGCDAMQGLFVAPPLLTLEEATAYLRAQSLVGLQAVG